MKRTAEVLQTKGKNALISVRRSSMCEGCEKQGGCGSSCSAGELFGANKTMTAWASNDAGAVAGDRVEVETKTDTVLRYAALVFLFPIALALVFYLVGKAFGVEETVSMLLSAAGFVLSFLVILVFDRAKKANPDVRITRIL